MSTFETLVLRGLWLILKGTLRGYNSGTAELKWAKAVAEAVEDDNLRNI